MIVIKPQIQEAWRTPQIINIRQKQSNTPMHIIVKLLKIKQKEKSLKAFMVGVGGENTLHTMKKR
jgi:hypothetical protein